VFLHAETKIRNKQLHIGIDLCADGVCKVSRKHTLSGMPCMTRL
jgi:hypothetical protein